MCNKTYRSFLFKGKSKLSIHHTDSRSQGASRVPYPSSIRRGGGSEDPPPGGRKVFPRANFADIVWRSRSDWRAHTERDHDGFWRRGPSNSIAMEIGLSILIHMRHSILNHPRVSVPSLACHLTSTPLLSVSSASQNLGEVLVTSPPGPKNDIQSTKEGAETVQFDVPMSGSGGELSGDPTIRITADSETEIVAPMKNSVVNLMMNHITDHLQFLALLTLRLSTEKLADGDIDTFSSSRSFSSEEGSGKRSIRDDGFGTDEGDEVPDIDQNAFFDKPFV
ncbi:hypothetical protein V8C34DRAFT_322810 [Trichoderma compactum]